MSFQELIAAAEVPVEPIECELEQRLGQTGQKQVNGSPVLGDLFTELDAIIAKYSSCSQEKILKKAEEIMKDPDVVKIRKKLYGFSLEVQQEIGELRELVISWFETMLMSEGKKSKVEEYALLESICHKKHLYNDTYKDWVLSKAAVSTARIDSSNPVNLRKSLDELLLNHSDLIYSHHYEELRNGKIKCKNDGEEGTVYYVGRLTIERELVTDNEKRNAENEILSAVSKILGMNGSEVRKNLEKAIENKGYTSLYEWFEQTRTLTIDLDDFGIDKYFRNGKREKIVPCLKEEIGKRISRPKAALIERIKDASLADKVILVKYLHTHPASQNNPVKRDMYDVGGFRVIIFDDISKCYDAKDWFEARAKERGLKINVDDKIKGRTGKDGQYRSLHIDVEHPATGVCFEVQIRTNGMDNDAEKDYRQSHQNHRRVAHYQIEELIKGNVVSKKEVLLTQLILTPTYERAHRRLDLPAN